MMLHLWGLVDDQAAGDSHEALVESQGRYPYALKDGFWIVHDLLP